jgi:tungstate transport system substrate-binding protein
LRLFESVVGADQLYNDFLIVGPSTDPAGVAGVPDAATALKRIADTHQRFLSRGGESGTHEREQQLWRAAGFTTNSSPAVVAGAGMGQTLRIADATGA